jgi:Ca2+-binding RTX toxin-like protein
MANFVPAFSTSALNGFTIGSPEFAIISRDVVVTATGMNQTALTTSGSNHVENHGTLAGYYALTLGGGSYLYNSATGFLSASTTAIYCSTGSQLIDNHGVISGGGVGIFNFFSTSLNIINSGSIIAGYESDGFYNAAILVRDIAACTVTIQNSGLIQTLRTGAFAIDAREASTIQVVSITNAGTISGGIALGDANDFLNTAAGRVIGTINMGEGNDTVVGSALADSASGGIGDDALAGNGGNDTLLGQDGNDTLNGGLGNDYLDGGIGNDTLFGGAGNDRLIGSAGNDFFVFNTALNASTNRDVIIDFNHVADTFKLENAVFTKLGAGVHALNPAFFHAGAKAADANDYIVYNKATGVLSYDNDGSGAHAAIAFAVLNNKPTLAANDFQVI